MYKNKIIILLSGFIIGIVVSYAYVKQFGVKNTSKNLVISENIKKDTYTDSTKDYIPKKEIIATKMPIYIKNSLQELNISIEEMTKKSWEEFISRIQTKALNDIVYNSKSSSSRGSDNLVHILSSRRDIDHKLIKELIEKGFNINEKNNFGDTPVLMAIKASNLIDIKALVAMGADLQSISNYGRDALAATFQNGNGPARREIIEYLLEEQGFSLSDNPNKYLKYMVNHDDNRPYIKQLLPLIEKTDYKESLQRILFYGRGDDEIVDFFIDAGLNIDQKLLNAMSRSKFVSTQKIQSVIDKYSLNVNEGSRTLKLTPLMAAVESGDSKKVELYLRNGANPNIATIDGHNSFDLLTNNPINEYWVADEEKIKIKKLLDKYR